MRKKRNIPRLLLVALLTFALPFLTGVGGTAFAPPTGIEARAEGSYDKVAVELAMATAFYDAQQAVKTGDATEEQLLQNLSALTANGRFGNVGLIIGPRGGTGTFDAWSIYTSKTALDDETVKRYDQRTNNAFSAYMAFGSAVQALNARAQATKGNAYSIEKGLNELSSAAAKMTNLGTRLLVDYNPAPLVLAFFDANELNTNSENKLVALVNNNRDLVSIVSTFGSNVDPFGVPLSFLIMGTLAFLLFVTSGLMTLFNGRAAGENIRKAIIRVAVGCLAVPMIAKGMDMGISFLGETTVTQANVAESNYVEQNLNFADWYACGFSLPNGTTLAIDEDGEFVLPRATVRKINEFTYQMLTNESPDDVAIMKRMERIRKASESMPVSVTFTEPRTRTGADAGRTWKTEKYYEQADKFGNVEAITTAGCGHLENDGLTMQRSGNGWTVYGRGTRYGIAPIAKTNLMRTTFSETTMTANNAALMGSVAFDVDNGSGLGTGSMNAIVRFMATFSMVMAAMKGLFTVFAAGFAGVVSGGAKSSVGSIAGAGQALGGILALVGGVFGIGVIMTMSFTLLDQVYGVIVSLLDTGGDTSIFDPFAELFWNIPILSSLAKSGASFVASILCMFTLPKFGGIPVTLFCQWLAELPHLFAERGLAVESKLTGDFRAGGGRGPNLMANASQLANQAANEGANQANGVKAGLGAAAMAVGMFGLNKAGGYLASKYAADGSLNQDGAPGGAQGESGADGASPKGAPAVDPANMNAPDASKVSEMGASPVEGADVGGDGTVINEGGAGDATTNETLAETQAVVEGADNEVVHDSTSDVANEVTNDTREFSDQESSDSFDATLDAYAETTTDASSLSEVRASEHVASMNETVSDTKADSKHEASSEHDSTHTTKVQKDQVSAGGAKSVNPAGTDKKEMSASEKRAKLMRSVGVGMQYMSGHMTGGEAALGAIAGMTHAAGSAVGHGNVTAAGVQAAQAYHARREDYRQGAYRHPNANNQGNAQGQAKKPQADARNHQNAQRQRHEYEQYEYERLWREAEEAERRRRAR